MARVPCGRDISERDHDFVEAFAEGATSNIAFIERRVEKLESCTDFLGNRN
jgi:hypothetical protein